MSENKKKYAYWMQPSMVAEIEEMLPEANVRSKGEFVCKAVEFYIGYLRSQKNMNYLAPVLMSSIKSELRTVERHLSEMLFKVAVEQAVNSNVLAALCDVDEETIPGLRRRCAQMVAENNGLVTFEDANDFQHRDTY